MSSSVQTDSIPSPAHVCVNCQHGQSFTVPILRGQLQALLKEDVLTLLSPENRFFTVEMVEALENLSKVFQWRFRCMKEQTRVRLFERGCYSWQPVTAKMNCVKTEKEQLIKTV